jgi:SM-20-related protein
LRSADEIVAALHSRGWYQCEHFLAPVLVAALRADLLERRAQFSAAGVGRGHQLMPAVRLERTLWLRGESVAQRTFFALLEQLRLELNRRLLLGLFDYEAHYADYPPGAYYRRHSDGFAGAAAPARVLSTVFYLNEHWRAQDGGELVLWDGAGQELARVVPSGGRALFFLSAEFPHEVRVTAVHRYSIAGWFRNSSRADPPTINPPPVRQGADDAS